MVVRLHGARSCPYSGQRLGSDAGAAVCVGHAHRPRRQELRTDLPFTDQVNAVRSGRPVCPLGITSA